MLKTNILIFVLVGSVTVALSQSSYNKEFIFQKEVFGIQVTEVDKGRFNYNVAVFSDVDTLFDFGVVELEGEVFNKKFRSSFQKALYDNKDTLNSEINALVSRVFSEIVINRQKTSNAPIAGVLSGARQVMVYSNSKKEPRKLEEKSYSLDVDSVQIEIYEGNIKNLTLSGTKEGSDSSYIFYCWWPIPFSALYDYGFRRRPKAYSQKLRADHRDFIYIDHLLTYNPKLNLNSEDYSPRNQVYTLRPHKEKSTPLYKEELRRILNARIYSDFAGISDDNPNGLVQTEIGRKFIINHTKRQTSGMAYFGWFNYVEPKIILSKIEENNKYLRSENFNSNKSLTTIDLRNHQIFSLNLPINLLAFNYPYFKGATDINVGFGINRVGVSDTLFSNSFIEVRNVTLSTSNIFLELKQKLNPDTRYGLELSIKPEYLSLMSDEYAQITSFEENTVQGKRHKWLMGLELDGHLKTGSSKSSVFVRVRSIHQLSEWNLNFFQFQVGYNVDIFASTKKSRANDER